MSRGTKYRVLGVPSTTPLAVLECTMSPAPSDQRLAAWAQRKKLAFVMRYFPSKKGWILFDMRNIFNSLPQLNQYSGAPYSLLQGIKRLPRTYPSEDAAVMKAMHLCNLPVQEELAL